MNKRDKTILNRSTERDVVTLTLSQNKTKDHSVSRIVSTIKESIVPAFLVVASTSSSAAFGQNTHTSSVNLVNEYGDLRSELIRVNKVMFSPEVGSYLANIQLANELFYLSLFDREAALSDDERGVWIRYLTTVATMKDATTQLRSHSDNEVVQLGLDVYNRIFTDNTQVKFGVMYGYSTAHHKTDLRHTSTRADGKTDGYSVGLYGTWYLNQDDIRKAYIDTWLQHAWFDHQVNGKQFDDEKYRANGWMASIETGYTFKLADRYHNALYIQPQVQFAVADVQANTHQARNGMIVEQDGNADLTTRLGIRLFGDAIGNAQTHFKPYAEINWLKNNNNAGAKFDGIHLEHVGAKNVGEFKLGANSKLGDHVIFSGNTLMKMGSHNYHAVGAQINLKVSF